jgi:hypothetical protein
MKSSRYGKIRTPRRRRDVTSTFAAFVKKKRRRRPAEGEGRELVDGAVQLRAHEVCVIVVEAEVKVAVLEVERKRPIPYARR